MARAGEVVMVYRYPLEPIPAKPDYRTQDQYEFCAAVRKFLDRFPPAIAGMVAALEELAALEAAKVDVP